MADMNVDIWVVVRQGLRTGYCGPEGVGVGGWVCGVGGSMGSVLVGRRLGERGYEVYVPLAAWGEGVA